MHVKTRRTARKLHLAGGTSAARRRAPASSDVVAACDDLPGTPLSCTPIIMGRKGRGLR